MKTSNNENGIGLDEKKDGIGKFLRSRPPESFKDDGKLPEIVGHALIGRVRVGLEVKKNANRNSL